MGYRIEKKFVSLEQIYLIEQVQLGLGLVSGIHIREEVRVVRANFINWTGPVSIGVGKVHKIYDKKFIWGLMELVQSRWKVESGEGNNFLIGYCSELLSSNRSFSVLYMGACHLGIIVRFNVFD